MGLEARTRRTRSTDRATAREALDYLFGARHQAAKRVVLLDLKLPPVGNFKVLKRIRAEERTRRTPVVILTSSTRSAT